MNGRAFVIYLVLFIVSKTLSIEGNKISVEDNEEEEFVPSNQWQRVKPGQAIPSGLHVKMDIGNGGKWAKLMDEEKSLPSGLQVVEQDGNEKVIKQTVGNSKYSIEELKHALKQMKEDANQNSKTQGLPKEDIRKKFKSIEEIQKSFNNISFQAESDVQAMHRLVATLKSTSAGREVKLAALQHLEHYVHQIDNAVDLFTIDGFGTILSQLNNTDAFLREEAANVIGSAVQSNPKAQVKALELGTMESLLRILSDQTQPQAVLKKSVFALSALIRQFPYAQYKMGVVGGFMVLKDLFNKDVGEQIRIKVIQLLYDLFTERQSILINDENTSETREKQQQYDRLPLSKLIVDHGWCDAIPASIDLSRHSSIEAVLRAMRTFISICANNFAKNAYLQRFQTIKNEYKILMEKEKLEGDDEGYFSMLHELLLDIQSSIKTLMTKDEL